MIVITLAMLGVFAYLYLTGTQAPITTSVAPGRLGAPAFSHYIYGGFGEEALNKPMYATFGNERIYVSDTNNFRIQVFSENGEPLFKFGERGEKDGQFFYPYGIVVGPEGNVYVADMYRNDIQIFSPDGEYIRTFAADKKDKSLLNGPGSLYLDSLGRLFVANVNSAQITVYNIETENLLGTVGLSGDMFAPNAVTVDEEGYIYVVDTGGQRVVVYTPDGSRPARIINGSEDGYGQPILSNPRGIAVRGDLIYVVSNLTHQIHAFEKNGELAFSWGKQGDKDNEFMHPNGMFVDSRGWMLITDTIGARVAVYK